MGVDEKFPPWVRISTTDALIGDGARVIADGSDEGWADYGRLVALRLSLARTPNACIDLGDAAQNANLRRLLNLDADGLARFVGVLFEAGAIDADSYESGVLSDPDMQASQSAYASRCAASKKANEARWSKSADVKVLDGGRRRKAH